MLILSLVSAASLAQKELDSCRVILVNDTLRLENEKVCYKYLWNNGYLISISITDKSADYTWKLKNTQPDQFFIGEQKPDSGKLVLTKQLATSVSPSFLRAEVTVSLGEFSLKRVLRIYPNCPAITSELYLKGKVSRSWETNITNQGELRNIETKAAIADGEIATSMLNRLNLPGNNWNVKAVEFFDVTDRNNNLVNARSQLAYRGESRLSGNLLFISNQDSPNSLFILKEAPTSVAQINYPGFDFSIRVGEIKTVGVGIDSKEIKPDVWTKCYGYAVGVSMKDEYSQLSALRIYQKKLRTHLPRRDDMILLNTWGDRNQDKSVNEIFALKEIEAGKKLGITHFQIDDGWQSGKSGNSAFAGGSFKNIWSNPDYWEPDKDKFPNGLHKVVEAGRKAGIEVCLWFNPSKEGDYADWQKDAAALIKLNKSYGIRTFKIDGVQVSNKNCETNLRKMLDTVMAATQKQAVFNLDVTAGKRYGYHYFNEYGNIFLENRYTDYGNYYPYWTLRNLWMLSRYVPPQNLQIEFLNNYRNKDKYPDDDDLAPGKMSFEYLFAITMMAQPLAWFEASGLPEDAFGIAPAVKKYRELQSEIHAGNIFPIGAEPDGVSWTGFQSDNDKKGYIILYRENNKQGKCIMNTWLKKGARVKFISVLGSGKSFAATAGEGGSISFALPQPNSYALYKYEVQ